MFLKRFKEKSNQKYINTVLNSRKLEANTGYIQTFGIILNYEEYHDIEALKEIFKEFNILEKNIKFLTYVADEKLELNSWDNHFNSKDIGWSSKLNNSELERFVNTKFDALISYYKADIPELNLVTAMSKGSFKIGISDYDKRLYDFIIDITPHQIDIFKTELVKYLKVLKKIQ